jgi:hypothetical protein
MDVLRFHMDLDASVPVVFDHLHDHFGALGYRTEEADRMNYRLVMDRGSLLGALLGGPVRHRGVWMRAYLEPRAAGGTQVTFSFTGHLCATNDRAREVYEEELRQVEAEIRALPPASSRPTAATPAVVREVVIREIVRIPCRYCGALVDQTATRCVGCGAPLGGPS